MERDVDDVCHFLHRWVTQRVPNSVTPFFALQKGPEMSLQKGPEMLQKGPEMVVCARENGRKEGVMHSWRPKVYLECYYDDV